MASMVVKELPRYALRSRIMSAPRKEEVSAFPCVRGQGAVEVDISNCA